MKELCWNEAQGVGGAAMSARSGVDVRLIAAIAAFEVGWAIGTYIDQTYIAPLWK